MTRDNLREAVRQFDSLPDSAFVRMHVICVLFAISKPTAWRWIKQKRLPAPKKLGPRVTAFRVADVRRALQERSQLA
jgi:predicted DNA-binding transcriptional regulator AlpA